jgi:hypothetical protein
MGAGMNTGRYIFLFVSTKELAKKYLTAYTV